MKTFEAVVLLMVVGVSTIQSQAILTTSGRSRSRQTNRIPRHRLPKLELTHLQEVPIITGNFTTHPIGVFREDLFQRGTFLFSSKTAIMRYQEGEPTSVFLGSTESNTTSPFTLVSDFVQYGGSKLAIADLLLGCVQEYDYNTRNLTTLLGMCDRNYMNVQIPRAGQSLSRLSKFMLAPELMQYVEIGNYLIFHDFGYKQLIRHDLGTDTVRLFDSSLYEKLPNLQSMLINKRCTKMYASHSYGLSVVDLDTMDVTILVGEKVNDQGYIDRPLVTGSFGQASIGKVESLRWVYNNEVIAGIKAHEDAEGVVVFDLRKRHVSSHCIGNSSLNTTEIGDPSTCKLNSPTALSVVNETMYIATLTEGNIGSYTFTSNSSLYRMDIIQNFCVIYDHSQYVKILPKLNRYFLHQAVNLRCQSEQIQQYRCIRSNADPSQYVWNKPLPMCN